MTRLSFKPWFTGFITLIFSVTIWGFHIVMYFPTWDGNVDQIQYKKLTCINYSFILPSNGSGGITSLTEPDRLNDLVTQTHANGKKICIAVGGWNNGDDSYFESMASKASTRTTFVKNLLSIVKEYSLDGVDIDWEYPDQGTSATNYAALMKELADSLHKTGKILSAAVVASGDYNGLGIKNEVFNYVDYLNIMSYDHDGQNHSSWDDAVADLDYWLGRGLPKAKAVLGLPFYGRSSTQYVAYSDLVKQDPQAPNKNNVGSVYYNGIPLIKQKTTLALQKGGGVMAWELSQDTHDATSLLSAIYDVVTATDIFPFSYVPFASENTNQPKFSIERGKIHMILFKEDHINITLHNCSGREVETVAKGYFTAGAHVLPINSAHKASGVYVVSLENIEKKITRTQMIIY